MTESSGNSMKAFYQNPLERRRWGKTLADAGLYPTEKELIRRFFPSVGAVLNVGCGGGRECLSLAKMGYRVTAVDIDEEFVHWTKEASSKGGLPVDCRVMDAGKLDFDDGAFDAVMMVGQLIGHIRGRENRVEALAEAARVVKPGGVGLFSTNAIEAHWKYGLYFALANAVRKVYNPNGFERNDAFVFRSGARRRFFGRQSGDPVFHWYRVGEFQRDLLDAGWKPLEYLQRKEFEKTRCDIALTEIGETFHTAGKLP
jgi:SAM-dependent methyltransferase